ncbi:MAG: efflux RND transporter periplasmic adaptor subunit [Chromatiales bacterium]|nr:efflux RND transporter periplasmic adaptor subunit [Gammaproteobacteria bacterium]MCP5352330.1 efflux RND transporter periplasmic adaptor subunit [Chromatiales bacterium]
MNKAATSVLIAGLVAAGLLLSNVHAEGEGGAPTAATAAAHDVLIVQSQASGGVVVLGGTVMPEKIVNLSAQMPGDVEFVGGSEGDAFKKGDRLIALSTTALQAKRRQAESQLASADAGYRNALVQYNREVYTPNSQSNSMLGGMPGMFSMFSDPMRSMMGQGSPGYERHSNLYGQGVQIETARNAVDQARAAIRELDESLENAVSYAPFDGVILKKMVEENDIVQPGMPLVTFADVTKLQVRVEVPSGLLNVVKQGGSFQAKLDDDTAPIPVEVDRVFPMADPGGHTTTVKFNLPAGVVAHSGQYAEVLIPDPSKSASDYPSIPKSAILWRGSLPAVFLVDDAGELKLRLIRIGDETGSGDVSVISGIKVGDRILANPSAGTRAGS